MQSFIVNHLFKVSKRKHPLFKVSFLHLAPPFLIDDHETVGVSSHRHGLIDQKVKNALTELSSCNACPRNCGVNRLENISGVCRVGRKAIVSSVFPHFGEESVLQGWNGSGTVFFGSCNLRCVFCQNWDISQKKSGWELDAKEISDLMLKLQDETNCHNINLVTPEHVVPQIVEALSIALDNGLNIPVIYNTSAYDSINSLKMMDGLVDIYMPDFKFWEPTTSKRLCKAEDYPQVARQAIMEMYSQVGDLKFDRNGIAKSGLLIRHLVMPGLLDEGKHILKWIVDNISKDCFVNIMDQYQPLFRVGSTKEFNRAAGGWTRYEEISSHINPEEMEELKDYATEIGLWRFEEPREW